MIPNTNSQKSSNRTKSMSAPYSRLALCCAISASMLFLSGCVTNVGRRNLTVSKGAMAREGIGKEVSANTVSLLFLFADPPTAEAQTTTTPTPEQADSRTLGQVLFPICEIGYADFSFDDQRPIYGISWDEKYSSTSGYTTTSYGSPMASGPSEVTGHGVFGQIGYRLDLVGCFVKSSSPLKVFVDLSVGYLRTQSERAAGGSPAQNAAAYGVVENKEDVDVETGLYVQPRIEVGLWVGFYLGVNASYEKYFSDDLENGGTSLAACMGFLF